MEGQGLNPLPPPQAVNAPQQNPLGQIPAIPTIAELNGFSRDQIILLYDQAQLHYPAVMEPRTQHGRGNFTATLKAKLGEVSLMQANTNPNPNPAAIPNPQFQPQQQQLHQQMLPNPFPNPNAVVLQQQLQQIIANPNNAILNPVTAPNPLLLQPGTDP